jgi:glycosyltransferase involved in cell wall biosynthesis
MELNSILPTPFLSFLIITYRRPDKVFNLLTDFLSPKWLGLDLKMFEIVIADDHSEDNTLEVIHPILEELKSLGWSVRYVYRKTNLRGDRNLYDGFSKDSRGEYVWFLCDDDRIEVQEAIKFIEAIDNIKPSVAICGFEQGDYNQFGTKFDGDVRLIEDYTESIEYLVKFPKTTAYLMRRRNSADLDELFEKLDLSLFSWIGLSIYLLGIDRKEKLLIYPNVVAHADQDYGLLRYSYRVFGNLYNTTKISLEYAGYSSESILPKVKNLKSEDELLLNLMGLQANYDVNSTVKYTKFILREELRYLGGNWRLIFIKRERFLAVCKVLYRFGESHFKRLVFR